jgi:nicotinate-nucleotide pyrophosphorylase (carboxylating)
MVNDIDLEVSGGISIENVADYAKTNVKYISIGALTHSAPALDLGFDAI